MTENTKISLTVITPEGKILQRLADSIVLPGADGAVGIMRDHIPMMALISSGNLNYTNDGQMSSFFVKDGIADVKNNSVTVYTD